MSEWSDRCARRLIERGADVDWRDESQQSAHLVAASEGYLDLLRLTLRHGADVDVHDSFDGTGLIRAAERGHDLVVGRLLQTETPVDHVEPRLDRPARGGDAGGGHADVPRDRPRPAGPRRRPRRPR